MAREMKAIELQKRDHITHVEEPDASDHQTKCSKELCYTVDHTMSIEGADSIMNTATWPTFSPQTEQFQYSATEFLSTLNAKCQLDQDDGPWALASRAYRGVLFHPGEIVCKDGANDYFMVVGQFAHWIVLLWTVVPMDFNNNQFKAFAVGTGLTDNSSPTWASPLEMDDFQAVPTRIV